VPNTSANELRRCSAGARRSRTGSFPQPQEGKAAAGRINDVGDEVVLGDSGFVEFDPGYLSTAYARGSRLAPLHQPIDDNRRDIGGEPNQIGPSCTRKVDTPRHTR
jgi:hypothetical protein